MGGTSFRASSRTSSKSTSRFDSYYSDDYCFQRSSRSCYGCCSSSTTHHVSDHNFGLLDFGIIVGFVIAIYLLLTRYAHDDRHKTSLLKLQVALSDTARSLQKNLNQIAESVDTSTPKGIGYMLQETTLSMLKHLDYGISGYSSVSINLLHNQRSLDPFTCHVKPYLSESMFNDILQVEVNRGADECEKRFNKLSIEERLKFNKETLVNFNNIRKQSAPSYTDLFDYEACNKYIVVTVVVAASGFHELPSVKSRELLKIALEKLASIPSNDIKAADVLWTPQKEDDSLTEKEVLKDFPLLLPL
ncbi:FLUCTUATING-LIGHT-ACCLIMATION protein 1, chloroplastic-like isoform X1 [Bidens hawaiensis]|uniref:FLUCTUATING-LIGHT-ACCLIMATION protein 1, chloroplastic-like isoform X1 n=1 Tax=Bidens hawaiensis TaxID=980011 RepID=UPI00404A6FB5